MRILFFIIFCCFILQGYVFADIITENETSSVTPRGIAFEECTKMFPLNSEQLFLLTLGAINANKFTVDEIQSNYGYVVFIAAKNKYLATVASIDKENAILKITPCNNIYVFQPGIISNIYKYVDMNRATVMK